MSISGNTVEQINWLKERWKGDLPNLIVLALNEGQDITLLLEQLPQQGQSPHDSDRLDLRGIDLSHQNLRGPWSTTEKGRNRIGVYLKEVDLSYADLSWAMLPRADLRGAVLKGTCLDHAELIYADFTGADLSGATLQGAWLLDTLFYDAKITETQLKQRRSLGQLDFDYHAFEI